MKLPEGLEKRTETRELISGSIPFEKLERLIIESYGLDDSTTFDWGSSSVHISSNVVVG